MSNSVALVPIADMERMAQAIAKSGLFGAKDPNQALALMLIAQAEGMHPAIAARDYHIIQGRPALKADAMLARFQAAGGKVEWSDYTDSKVIGTFTHASGGSVKIEWTIDMATKAGLTKNPTWRQYPRQMLRARCISEGIRTVFPGVVSGFYTPEEVSDFAPEKDVTPQPEPAAKPTPAPEAIKAKAAAMKADSAKAAKANQPVANVIEGSATVISSADEGDLSGIGNNKPDATALGKVVHAFANIGYTIEMLEAEYGKRIDEWTMADMDEARQVYALKAAERKAMLAQMAAEKAGAAATEETVI